MTTYKEQSIVTIHIYTNDLGELLVSPFPLSDDPDLLNRQIDWLHQAGPQSHQQSAWAREGRLGINPDFFVSEMSYLWCVAFRNIATPKLLTLWRTMAETFNKLLSAQPCDPWEILAPETGTGKTQGSVVYAALLSLYTPQGVLFVTSLTDQCDQFERDVTEFAMDHCGRYGLPAPTHKLALAYHTDLSSEPTEEELQTVPVLAITHSRMLRLFEAGLAGNDRFGVVTNWQGGRRLRVLDETPSGLLKVFEFCLHDLQTLTGAFVNPRVDRDEFEAFMLVQEAWERYETECSPVFPSEDEEQAGEPTSELASDLAKDTKVFAFSDYLDEGVSPKTFDLTKHFEYVRNKPTPATRTHKAFQKEREQAIKTLLGVQNLLKEWAVSLTRPVKGTTERRRFVTTAKLITPPDDIPMVVLDATAGTSPYWKVFSDKEVHRVDVEKGVRDYSNVTAHLCYQKGGVGKGTTKAQGKGRITDLLKFFHREHNETGRLRKVLVVLHKDAEKFLPREQSDKRDHKGDPVLGDIIVPNYLGDLKSAHWGALTGLNDYRDMDTVVVLSHPYPPEAFAVNLLFSSLKPEERTEEFLQASHKVRGELRHGEMLVHIVQAVNRVRCRKVTTASGGCEPVDIFMLMNSGESHQWNDLIEDTLQAEMQGLMLDEWNLKEKAKATTGLNKGSLGDKLVRHLRNQPSGTYLWSDLMAKVGGSEKAGKKLRLELAKTTSSSFRAFRDIGCVYELKRVGSRDQATVIKH